MTWITLFLFLLAPADAAKAAKQKLTCNDKELARQDCRLYSGDYNIRLLPKTIAWSDGTWHTVDPMPLNGEAADWEKISFSFMKDWPVLQLWLWDKGEGETRVQSLHWIAADAEKRKFTVLSEGLVRKRRPEELEAPADGKARKPVKAKFLYDAWESHSLKTLKNGELEWQLGSVKKTINRSQIKTGGTNGI